MSATLHIPSSGGGIVVDSGQSGGGGATAAAVGDGYHQQGQGGDAGTAPDASQEVGAVVSAGNGSNLTGSVINLATNEIIAAPQIIKLVSSDDGGERHQMAVGQEISGTIRGMSGAVTSSQGQVINNSQSSGSKVHVISNVTLVSKAPVATQQTINFVNATSNKTLNSSANSGGGYINAFVSKTIPQSGKIVNLVNPIKGAAGGQMIPKSTPNVQKVSVPRNVQVLTRVQTLTHATLGGNIIMSRLTQPQQFQQASKQAAVKAATTAAYNSSGAGMGKAPKIVSGTTQQIFQPGMKIYTAGSVAGHKLAQSVKTVTKATPLKAAPQPVQMNKMMKQVFTTNSPAPNLASLTQQYPTTTNIPKSPGIQIQSTPNSGVPVKFSSLAPGQQIGGTAQVRALSNMGNLVIQSGGAQKNWKATNKIIQVQQPNSPIVSQTQQITPAGNQIKMLQNVTTVPSFNIIQGGTIKYVNAQGNVTQPPAPKLRTNSTSSMVGHQLTPVSTTAFINNATTDVAATITAPMEVSSNTTVDDMMYMNGMSMDEEISARILQSLSQKAVINNNRYVQQQKYLISSTPNTVQTSMEPVQIQSYPVAQYQGSTDVKHGPEYFRVNTSDLQTTTTTFIDNIPLVATNEEYYQRDQNYDQDDYTDGEEQITAKDAKFIMQHPALQDHTYAAPMPEGMTTQEAPQENFQQTSVANATDTSLAHILMGYSCNQQKQDDDNNSVISNDSRNGKNPLDNDLGEETETAPEGEGEDDSVTRCICDLTHDDGYMICCDKCSAWQHVDCMGIDRQNIPDEYNCEMCQPRPVDKARARNLQLIKRKEQQALMMLNTLPQQTIPLDGGVHLISSPVMEAQRSVGGVPLNSLSPGSTKKQRSVRKKGDGFVAAKRQKRESGGAGRANGKRKETKKVTKRKGKQQQMQNVENGGGGGLGEKTVMNLRAWIENYEQAVTNHYSPELRARLQALGKQQSHQQLNSQQYNLRNVGNLDGKCGTVPHAGGKILISSHEMTPNTPIVEIRGKYMLSGQYKQQLITSSNSTRNYGLNRNPGPFIFFYRLPNDGPEICVDTRTYGNEARFVRRSCRPNAEVVHFIEKGTIHLYIVSMLNIKESTEITIRHEPHDLIGVAQGSVVAPTSTVCACGLTKDCLFPNSGAPPLPQPAGGGGGGSTKPSGKRVNGTYHGKNSKEGGYKRSKALSRNRSTSSSGESNVGGLLSPNGQVFVPNQISTTALAPPSIQPQLLEAAAAALSSPQASLPPTVTQMLNQYPPSPTRNHLNISAASSATTMSIPETPTLLSPNLEQVASPKESINVAMLSPILPPQVAPESPVKIPKPAEPQQPEIPQQTNAQQPQPANPPPATTTNPPKAPTKRVQKQKSAPTTPLIQEECEKKSPIKLAEQEKQTEQAAKEAPEQRKLTREERKMEAILKAFEKMEKTSQRKQELKQQKTSDRASTSGASSSVSRRRNSFSPFGGTPQKLGKDEDDRKALNNHQAKKKKRKGSKSYQQTNTQRKRRRSRVNSNDSDNATSEESGAMLSPPLPGHSLYRHSEPVKVQPGEDNVAGMLLALAKSPGESKMEPLHIAADGTDVSTTGPFHGSPLSSVCMLVEAAVAPLENQCAENDFKLPPKTKTKKTIMNEWLNQADAGIYPGSEAFGAPASKNLETLVQAAVSIHAPQHYRGVAMQEEPQNLSMMAKKVEEFITLNDTKAPQEQSFGTSEDEEVLQQQRTQQQTEGTAVLQVPPPLPTPPMAGGSESAVKKRWLRQAISEECLDEMVPSPPNGFMTPLKKRRFTRQYSDHPEDLSPTQTGFFAMTPQSEDSTKIEFPETPETTETTETPEIARITETVAIKTEEEVKSEENPEEATVEIKTEAQEVPKNEIEMKENAEEAIKVEEEEKKPIEEGIKEEIIDKAPHSSGEIEPEVFDIEPLNASKDIKEDDGNLADIEDVNNDEIADLQKKIHSFHAENIQILKSRNRKAKQRAASEEKCERKLLKVRKKRLSSDTDEHATKTKVKKIKSRSASRSPKHEARDDAKEAEAVAQPSVPPIELPPSFNSSIPPPTSVPTYSSYLLNNATNLMTNVPPPNTFTMPSMFNANYPPPQMDDFHRGPGMEMRLAATNVPPPPPPQLSDYLDKSTTFRDIFTAATNLPQGAPPGATRSPYFATLNTVPPQPVPPPAVPPVAPTGFLPKATFTTLDPIPAGPAAVAAAPTPRIYQRTASADPRLNPNISVPEPPPAPKRKLSITEYRKRKQQSTDSSTANDSKSPPDTADQKDLDGDFGITKNPDGLSDCKDDSSSSASATKTPSTPEENVPFSPTPTLLELQQESLSERLKNYKSLQELSSGPSARESFSNQDGSEENPSVSSTTCDAVISSTVVATIATTDPDGGEEKVCEDAQEEITTTSEIGVSDVKVPEENP